MVILSNDCTLNLEKSNLSPLFEKDTNKIIGSSTAFKDKKGKLGSLELLNLDDDQMQFNSEELTCSRYTRYHQFYLLEV